MGLKHSTFKNTSSGLGDLTACMPPALPSIQLFYHNSCAAVRTHSNVQGSCISQMTNLELHLHFEYPSYGIYPNKEKFEDENFTDSKVIVKSLKFMPFEN